MASVVSSTHPARRRLKSEAFCQAMKALHYLALLLVAFVFKAHADSQPWDDPNQWIQEHEGGRKYRESDNKLIEANLKEILGGPDGLSYKTRNELESLLVEVSFRKSADWEGVLKQTLKEVRLPSNSKGETEGKLDTRDLEVLTVLRRLQKKPQPMSIRFAPLPRMQWEFPTLPVLKISARRHMDEPEDFRFKFGGDYRSGRQTRWTILVWDSQGRLLPRRGRIGFGGVGGGVFHRGPMGVQVWESNLSLTSFLDAPVLPGRYRGCIAYHDEVSIADRAKLGGYVLSYSAPFEFEVAHRMVEESKITDQGIRSLVHGLPVDGEVKILSATYSKSAHDFIDPGSAAGKLLSEGWHVVPALTRHLADPDLTSTQRAWGLGILHSITSCKDPTEERALVGTYVKQSGGFWIQNKIDGKFSNAGGGIGATSTSSGGEVDSTAQLESLKEWQTLVTKLIVTQTNAAQDGADQPTATAESKPEGAEKPEPKPEVRPNNGWQAYEHLPS